MHEDKTMAEASLYQIASEALKLANEDIARLQRGLADAHVLLSKVEQERDHHKRVRKAITRQLKDVEKARKYEFGLYLERFQVAQDVIKSMRDEIKKITEEYKNKTVSVWKFWK